MANTPNLPMPLLSASQSQKHVTHNQALRVLDALQSMPTLMVEDDDLTAPPVSPADGDTYLVGSGATGAWAGHDGDIAYYDTNGWVFYDPSEGWLLYLKDEDAYLQFDGANWVGFPAVQQNLAYIGINATADTTNRLAVASDAILFDYATDDIQVKLNKQAAGDTASFLFQQNFNGFAEFGLTGDNNFHLKVSPDNFSTPYEAFTINKDNGQTSFFQKVLFDMIASGWTGAQLELDMGSIQTTNNASTTIYTVTVAEGEIVTVFTLCNGLKDDGTEGITTIRACGARRASGGNVGIIGAQANILLQEDDAAETPSFAYATSGASSLLYRVNGGGTQNYNWVIATLILRSKSNT
jgi:hypothetical protein